MKQPIISPEQVYTRLLREPNIKSNQLILSVLKEISDVCTDILKLKERKGIETKKLIPPGEYTAEIDQVHLKNDYVCYSLKNFTQKRN